MRNQINLFSKMAIVAVILINFNFSLSSFGGTAHKNIMRRSLEIMQKGNEKQRWLYGFYQYHATRDNIALATTMADAAQKPDDFFDTVIGGWWIGYRYFISVDSMHESFSTMNHFTSAYKPGRFGDRYSGRSFANQPAGGFLGKNNTMKLLLWNQDVRSGAYENAKGLVLDTSSVTSWLNLLLGNGFADGKVDWGAEGAPDMIVDYQTQTASRNNILSGRQSTASGKPRVPSSNWEDMQDAYFNPSANVGQYWYNQFTEMSQFDRISKEGIKKLAHVMHWAGDNSVPQHVWNTTDHFHTAWEQHANGVSQKEIYNNDKITQIIEEFRNSKMTTYAQTFAVNAADTPDSSPECYIPTTDKAEVSIRCLKVNGKIDPTLYSVGDILRWLSERAVKLNAVLSSDEKELWDATSETALLNATVGIILILEKSAADLYKKKQYAEISVSNNGSDYWGYGVFQSASKNYNQIR